MKIIPRRTYDDDIPSYLEGDKDYVLNNTEAAVRLLDRELKTQLSRKLRLKQSRLVASRRSRLCL